MTLAAAQGRQQQLLTPGRTPAHDADMETRITQLENFAGEARVELRAIDLRLTKIETRLDQTATKADMESVKAEIYKSSSETHKWMLATIIGLFLGFGGLFLAMSNALKPSVAMSPQPPIIISVPQAAPAK